MTKLSKFALIAAFLTVAAFIGYQGYSEKIANASVNSGQEVFGTTTDSTFGSNSTTTKVCSGTCKLMSVIVASSSPDFAFGVWDSTAASGTPGTKLATFPKNAVAGTYTYDNRSVTNGIVLDIPAGFNGVYTVTYRNF